MDGFELLLFMQNNEYLKGIPLIIATFDNEQVNVERCLENGAKDYLIKPLRIKNLKDLAKYVTKDPSSYKVIKTIRQAEGISVDLVIKRLDGQFFAQKTISLKNMNYEQKLMVRQEIKLLKIHAPPCIIRYYESYIQNDYIQIIMEYAREGTLSDKIEENKLKGVQIDEEKILYLTAQIIISVLFMHSNKILHRDIKTQNLFFTNENIVKLELGANVISDKLVDIPYFMSPEVCSGQDYGEKADIWAIGCTLYEMVMFKKPFDIDDLKILFSKIRCEAPPPLHENVSTEIRMLILLMLEKDPLKRPSVWELAEIPIIQKNIIKYYEEEAQNNPFLREYIFSGPKIHLNKRKKNQLKSEVQNSNEEIFKALSLALSPYDQKISMFRVERNVINEMQIFQWIQENYPNFNTIQIGQMINELVYYKYLHRIEGPLHQSNLQSLYRFYFDMPGIAANLAISSNLPIRPALQCLQEIIETANEVLTQVTDKLYGQVLDEKLYQNKKYQNFLDLVCQLQNIYFKDLYELEKKCLFINLLQIMYFHQFMKQRYTRIKDEKKQKVQTLFETLSSFLPFQKSQDQFYYTISNFQFTLDEIKHGILRGNKTHKLSSFKPFQENDSRKQFVLTPDLRVLMLFKEENAIPNELEFIKLETMDQQLDEICKKFVNKYVYIDYTDKILILHKIFQIYQTDFGPQPQDVIYWGSNYTKTLGIIAQNLVEKIKSGDIFIEYQERFES
ncbi:hypothetical protein ABPG74_015372 [Tetrahymena malaccensis]